MSISLNELIDYYYTGNEEISELKNKDSKNEKIRELENLIILAAYNYGGIHKIHKKMENRLNQKKEKILSLFLILEGGYFQILNEK